MDAHEREYRAAADGMADTYGRRAQGEGHWNGERLVNRWAVGDRVRWWADDAWHDGLVIDVADEAANLYRVVEHIPGERRRHHVIDGDAFAPW